MRTRSLVGSLVAGALLLSLPACSASRPSPEVVIGLLYPLSGPAAPAGQQARLAFELVADMVNGAAPMPPGPFYERLRGLSGLPGGARLRLVAADHRGRADIGRAEAERLVLQDRVHALIGASQSSVTAATSDVAERLGVPYVAPEATAAALTQRRLRWLFRTAPHDAHLSQAAFDFLADHARRTGRPLSTVALTHADTAPGAAAARGQRLLAQKYGYRVVADLTYPANAAAVTDEVRRLKVADPDVWLPLGSAPDAVLLLRTARTLDWTPRLVLAQDPAFRDPAFIAGAGGDAEGTLSPAPTAPEGLDRDPVARAFNAGYRARAGTDLTELSAEAITGLVTLLDAITRARSTAPAAIRAALVRTDIKPAALPVPWTGVHFDEAGQNVGVRPVVLQLQAGAYRTVWPPALASRDVVDPVPAARR